MSETTWLVLDDNGGSRRVPIYEVCGNYAWERYGTVYEGEREAVVAWAAHRRYPVREIRGPEDASSEERARWQYAMRDVLEGLRRRDTHCQQLSRDAAEEVDRVRLHDKASAYAHAAEMLAQAIDDASTDG